MIGGEFSISPLTILETKESNNSNKKRIEDNCYYYSSGRGALFQILKYLKNHFDIKEILLPNYLCNTVLVPITKIGLSYSFYPLDESLEIEQNVFFKLYSKSSVVLLVNYFGLQELSNQIKFIRDFAPNAIIIEDDVMAYFEFKKELNGVDFKYTSLRKTFAIPDGGIVKTNHKLPVVDKNNTYGQYKATAAMMKSMRETFFDDSVYLDISKIGNTLINDELDFGMSSIAMKLYKEVDEYLVIKRRKENATFLSSELRKIGISPILPLSMDKVPLFLPVRLNNRDEIRNKLFKNQIFCPIHWNDCCISKKYNSNIPNTELSLVIDQRYEEKDMAKIISLITQ